MLHWRRNFCFRAALLLALSSTVNADWRGHIAPEYLHFARTAEQGQGRDFASVSAQLEAWKGLNDGQDQLSFRGFVRWDKEDSERTHADIRELAWVHAGDGWETRAGIRQEFWGVTEALHWVDIVNQTDWVENLDGKQKLGQPMISLGLEGDGQQLDVYLLAGSRERTFPGKDGRLRLPVLIDNDHSEWESSRGRDRLDAAARWQWQGDFLTLAISGFSGNSREPEYVLAPTMTPLLVPYYPVIHQAGIEMQANAGDWLWKLEAISRHGGYRSFEAADAGFEYTQVAVLGSRMDLGWLAEWLYDGRGDNPFNPFQNDLFVGWRLAFNDAASSSLLFSLIYDPESDEQFWSLQADRRLGEKWSLKLESRVVTHTPSPQGQYDYLFDMDLQYALRPWARDSYFRLEVFRFF